MFQKILHFHEILPYMFEKFSLVINSQQSQHSQHSQQSHHINYSYSTNSTYIFSSYFFVYNIKSNNMFEKILRFHEIHPDMFEKVFFSQQESTESTRVNIVHKSQQSQQSQQESTRVNKSQYSKQSQQSNHTSIIRIQQIQRIYFRHNFLFAVSN